jgi:predicted component of type VI protein secretion system
MEDLKLKFEKEYNADFLEKIKQSEREIADGKTIKVNKDNLNEYLGL